MDSMRAFAMGRAATASGAKQKVFDWNKAAQIIKERQPREADAGLASDYEYTRGTIYRDGHIVEDSYTYLSSNWATPMLILDDCEEIPCYCTEESGWDADTKWPASAVAILEAESA